MVRDAMLVRQLYVYAYMRNFYYLLLLNIIYLGLSTSG